MNVPVSDPAAAPGPDDQELSLSVQDGVARISLAAPARGSVLNLETVGQLAAAVRAARDAACHVVVLTSRGSAFSVGGDLVQFAAEEDPGGYVDDLAEALHRVISDLHRMDAIVVSAVAGVAAGAGFPLAAAADLVLAAESATFTLAYTKVGLTPDGGSSLLTATLGLHRVLHLALLNPVLTARQALDAGLVCAVHADDELDAAVERTVATLRAGSRAAQVAAKHLVRGRALPHAEGDLRQETLTIRAAAAGPDGREGVRAFVEKRRPTFG